MHGDGGRDIRFDRVEELAELDAAMAPMTRAHDPRGLHIERREQRRGAVPFVVVRAALDLPRDLGGHLGASLLSRQGTTH
jgi:hypothetical protein